jgi:hypothetical protein
VRRRLTSWLACALLATSACGPSERDAERELAQAKLVSEQLNAEFADSVTGTGSRALAPMPSPQYATAVANALEHGVDLEAATHAKKLESVEACPSPNIDASSFRQLSIDPLPITMNAPSNYQLRQRATRVVGRDTMSATVDAGIDRIWFARSRNDLSYHDDGEWNVTSHCDDMVAGMHVHFDAAVKRASQYRRGVSASFRLPTGAYLVVQAEFHDAASQAAALYALRTVQFRSVWSPAP